MAAYRPVDTNQSFPALEEKVLARWRELDVFHETLRRREGAPLSCSTRDHRRPTAPPARTTCCRACSRTSFPATRRCGIPGPAQGRLGLPRPAGRARGRAAARISSKHAIEQYGIAEFNERCRESVFSYVEEWNRLTERIGFWIDLDDA